MSKYIITFGQLHTHRIQGKTFDCDCVAEVEAEDEQAARDLFYPRFCFSYPENKFDEDDMKFYHRGKIKINT